MNEKYAALVAQRKKCDTCDGLLNPSKIDNGRYDCDHIGAWSLWQGSLDAKVVIVGQDFSELAFFKENGGQPSTGPHMSPTNRNLMILIQKGLGLRIAPYERKGNGSRDLFFTNIVLCIKEGSASSTIKQSWANVCAARFLKPLLEEIIRPKVVISLSGPAYKGIRSAFNLHTPLKLSDVVEYEGGIPLFDECRFFPMYHCSGLGLVNRSFEKQLVGWKKVKRFV